MPHLGILLRPRGSRCTFSGALLLHRGGAVELHRRQCCCWCCCTCGDPPSPAAARNWLLLPMQSWAAPPSPVATSTRWKGEVDAACASSSHRPFCTRDRARAMMAAAVLAAVMGRACRGAGWLVVPSSSLLGDEVCGRGAEDSAAWACRGGNDGGGHSGVGAAAAHTSSHIGSASLGSAANVVCAGAGAASMASPSNHVLACPLQLAPTRSMLQQLLQASCC